MNLTSDTLKFMLARLSRIQPEVDNCSTEMKTFISDVQLILEDELRKATVDEMAKATFRHSLKDV